MKLPVCLFVALATTQLVRAGEWYDSKCGIPPLNKDRDAVVKFFAENVYGVRPAFPNFKPKYELVKTLDCGNCIRKEVRLNTMTPLGETNFLAVAYFPKKSGKVPVWVMPGFYEETQDIRNFAAAHKGRVTRWPVDLIVSNGHATVMFMYRWVLNDEANVLDGVKRPANGWGAIDVWALACSRCADWLETQPEADPTKLAVVGLSRLGKTALWAGATDTRFALVAPTCSGLFGARCTTVTVYGETIDRITKVFPHWFAPQCRTRWCGKDRELPFDQHWLLASVAPRLLAVGSATEDWWASPSGELAAFFQARNAWQDPKRCDYHVRRGGHNLLREDWAKYIEFARKHGW